MAKTGSLKKWKKYKKPRKAVVIARKCIRGLWRYEPRKARLPDKNHPWRQYATGFKTISRARNSRSVSTVG